MSIKNVACGISVDISGKRSHSNRKPRGSKSAHATFLLWRAPADTTHMEKRERQLDIIVAGKASDCSQPCQND